MTDYTISNDVFSQLVENIASTDTTIVVHPSQPPYNNFPDPATGTVGIATLIDSLSNPSKIEIITYEASTINVDGDQELSGVVRGQEGTSAQFFDAESPIFSAPTAEVLGSVQLESVFERHLSPDIQNFFAEIQSHMNMPLTTVTADATTTFDLTATFNHVVTLDQSTTFAFTLDAESPGNSGMIIIKQDATGGHTFTLPAEAKTPAGGASIAQETGANTISILNYFVVDSSNILVNYIGNFQ